MTSLEQLQQAGIVAKGEIEIDLKQILFSKHYCNSQCAISSAEENRAQFETRSGDSSAVD